LPEKLLGKGLGRTPPVVVELGSTDAAATWPASWTAARRLWCSPFDFMFDFMFDFILKNKPAIIELFAVNSTKRPISSALLFKARRVEFKISPVSWAFRS
jgi:hypothetical protein